MWVGGDERRPGRRRDQPQTVPIHRPGTCNTELPGEPRLDRADPRPIPEQVAGAKRRVLLVGSRSNADRGADVAKG